MRIMYFDCKKNIVLRVRYMVRIINTKDFTDYEVFEKRVCNIYMTQIFLINE
jgi:hypothetical protein